MVKSKRFTINGIDGDELVVHCKLAEYSPQSVERYLNGRPLSTNEMIGRAMFFADNPHLVVERDKRSVSHANAPVIGKTTVRSR